MINVMPPTQNCRHKNIPAQPNPKILYLYKVGTGNYKQYTSAPKNYYKPVFQHKNDCWVNIIVPDKRRGYTIDVTLYSDQTGIQR